MTQVEKTRELTGIATSKASAVTSQARAVTGVANSAAKASERQQTAFSKAKVVAGDAASAAEDALEAFRCRKSCFVFVSKGCRKSDQAYGQLW